MISELVHIYTAERENSDRGRRDTAEVIGPNAEDEKAQTRSSVRIR